MTSRRDLDRLSTANRRVVELAIEQLRELFLNFDFSLKSPDLVRDALMEIVPAMVSQFGDVAATAAADWYEQTRRAQVSGDYSAVFGDEVDLNLVDRNVRWASQPLFQGDAAKTLSRLEGAMQRHISYSTRATIARNAEHDPAKPRYARVPQGTFTCAFCVMLASRGWVYPSKETAQTAKDGGAYHNHCDCMIVPEWDREIAHIEGYDPDRLYEMYQAGRAESGSQDPRDIAQAMRRLYPTQLSDGLDVVRGGLPPKAWVKGKRIVGGFGGTPDLPGVFKNPFGEFLELHELAAVRTLLEHNIDVEWLETSDEHGKKNPDARIFGDIWDIKSPTGGSKNTISHQLSRGVSQAENIVIDLRRSSLIQDEAVAEIERRLRYRPGLSKVLVIKQDNSIELLHKDL